MAEYSESQISSEEKRLLETYHSLSTKKLLGKIDVEEEKRLEEVDYILNAIAEKRARGYQSPFDKVLDESRALFERIESKLELILKEKGKDGRRD